MTKINCPRDNSELVQLAETPWQLWHCDSCTGAFVKALPVHEYRLAGERQAREEWDTEVSCPEHGELMDALTVKGVAIDICRTCAGVWLDGDEIDTLLGSGYAERLSSEHAAHSAGSASESVGDTVGSLIDTLIRGAH